MAIDDDKGNKCNSEDVDIDSGENVTYVVEKQAWPEIYSPAFFSPYQLFLYEAILSRSTQDPFIEYPNELLGNSSASCVLNQPGINFTERPIIETQLQKNSNWINNQRT